MRILITGNMGYIGSFLVIYLRKTFPEAELIGFDSAFFGHCLTNVSVLPESFLDRQIFADVRDLSSSLLVGVDAVVHLAAISNDPMGNEFVTVTEDINRRASVRLAKLSARAGVKNFVFASSCSIYGYAEGEARKENHPTKPLTPYARSKIDTEADLANADLDGMVFTSLRLATACGMSDRLRLDLVLNDFVASAVTLGEITVLSDGTPWRPLIDVEDIARSISWAIQRSAENGGSFLCVNVGRDESNYQIKDLAEAVAQHVPGTQVNINMNALTDKRSYKVDFSLFKSLAPDFAPQVSLAESIERMYAGLLQMKFTDRNFRDSPLVRLNTLRQHIFANRLGTDLRWKRA
jgi:nucleoside-diphosphate-sugar epimerase